jgi:dihydroxyacid dehydratase/phosphogluconate dehydratase
VPPPLTGPASRVTFPPAALIFSQAAYHRRPHERRLGQSACRHPVSPEAVAGGPLAKVLDGDLIRLDGVTGTLQVLVSEADWAARPLAPMPAELRAANGVGMGRELFANLRRNALKAEEGACTWL